MFNWYCYKFRLIAHARGASATVPTIFIDSLGL
jgi:hypothetical protein